jgi:hypothetical protein
MSYSLKKPQPFFACQRWLSQDMLKIARFQIGHLGSLD